MSSIGLAMIVKNEAAVIRRCLESVEGIISHWVVCDTGSTDGTPEIISEMLKGIPGTLHRVPWVDFGFNRTQALQLARGTADYLLMIDADEVLNVRAGFDQKLTHDAYLLRFEGDMDYQLPLLLSDRHEWVYEGIIHECIRFDPAKPWVKLPELSITHYCDGDGRKDKFDREIQLLTRAVEQEPENERHCFYLAQTYRDIGQYEPALQWYEKRTRMDGWEEETWYARYQLARIMHVSGRNWPLVQNHYLAAYQARPQRLEPLLHVARYYREMNQFHLGYLFSHAVIETRYPEDILFVERNVYEYELPMEYAICCYWIGKHEEAIRVNDAVIANRRTPPSLVEIAKKNRHFSEQALAGHR